MNKCFLLNPEKIWRRSVLWWWCYPTPSEGWRRGNSTKIQQSIRLVVFE